MFFFVCFFSNFIIWMILFQLTFRKHQVQKEGMHIKKKEPIKSLLALGPCWVSVCLFSFSFNGLYSSYLGKGKFNRHPDALYTLCCTHAGNERFVEICKLCYTTWAGLVGTRPCARTHEHDSVSRWAALQWLCVICIFLCAVGLKLVPSDSKDQGSTDYHSAN